MKTTILKRIAFVMIVFCLGVGKSWSVNNNPLLFPDDNFELYLKNNFPSCFVNNVFQQNSASALAVKTIILPPSPNNNIKSIEGINNFTNLEIIQTNFNPLESFPNLTSTKLKQVRIESSSIIDLTLYLPLTNTGIFTEVVILNNPRLKYLTINSSSNESASIILQYNNELIDFTCNVSTVHCYFLVNLNPKLERILSAPRVVLFDPLSTGTSGNYGFKIPNNAKLKFINNFPRLEGAFDDFNKKLWLPENSSLQRLPIIPTGYLSIDLPACDLQSLGTVPEGITSLNLPANPNLTCITNIPNSCTYLNISGDNLLTKLPVKSATTICDGCQIVTTYSNAIPEISTNVDVGNDGTVDFDYQFTVNKTSDFDPTIYDVNECSSVGTFRWALDKATKTGNAARNRIVFNIPSGLKNAYGKYVIDLVSNLPFNTETNAITIDGITQPGSIIVSDAAYLKTNPIVWLNFNFTSGINSGGSSITTTSKPLSINDIALTNSNMLFSLSSNPCPAKFEKVAFFNDKTDSRFGSYATIISNTKPLYTYSKCIIGGDFENTSNYINSFGKYATYTARSTGLDNVQQFTDCKLYGGSDAFIGVTNYVYFANEPNLVTRCLFYDFPQNIKYPNFFTSISASKDGNNKLYGGTNNIDANKVEIFRTDNGINAIEFIGIATVNTALPLDAKPGFYTWTYTPGGTNKVLTEGYKYIAVASSPITTGEFSTSFYKENCSFFKEPLSTDFTANGITYDNVFVVTRTDDFEPSLISLDKSNIDDCQFIGTLRWAILKASYLTGTPTSNRIVFALPVNDNVITIKSDLSFNNATSYLEYNTVVVDGTSQNGYSASKSSNPKVIIDFGTHNFDAAGSDTKEVFFKGLWIRNFNPRIAYGGGHYENCVITNPTNVNSAFAFDYYSTTRNTYLKDCTIGKDRSGSDLYNGKFETLFNSFSHSFTITNCDFHNLNNTIVQSTTTATSKRSTFISDTKNIVFNPFTTIISGKNSDGQLFGTTSFGAANRVEIYETDSKGINAVKYIGYSPILNNKMVWVYDPTLSEVDGDITYTNLPLESGKSYIAVSSAETITGEFSAAFGACPYVRDQAFQDQYKTDSEGKVYDKVFVVTRNDDPCTDTDIAANIDDCNCAGTLRWALGKMYKSSDSPTRLNGRIVFDLAADKRTIQLENTLTFYSANTPGSAYDLTIDGKALPLYVSSSNTNPEIIIDFNNADYGIDYAVYLSTHAYIKDVFFRNFKTFTKSIASNGATEYINCVIANAKNHEKANLIEALRSHSHVFTNSTLGKDRTSSDAFTGKFTTAYLTPSYGSFYAMFRNSEVYNFDVVIDNSAYPNGVSTKSVLVSNTKNVNYPNTKTIISGVNTDGRLYGTSVLPYATTVEIFETNGTGIDAVKYVGSVALETGQGPKTWVYIPGGDNMDLLPGKNYIAISSTALYSGEFSDPYTLACANLVVNTDQYKTDGKGNTYDNVFVVTRTDDYDATGLTAEQQNNCQYIGTLRWALNTAARFNTVKTRIVFAESLKNQTIKILPGDLKLEGDNITVDGTTISGYSSSEAPLINIDFQYQSSFNNIYNYYIGSLPGKYTNIKGLNLLNGGKLNSFIHYMSQNNFLAEHVCFMFEDKPGYSPSDTFTVFMGIQGLSSNESLNFKNCVFGSDYKRTRTDLKPLSGFAKQDGGDLSQRRFIDCKFYGFPKASLNGANNKNLVTKSLFIGNKKNIENPGFKSSIFLNNQDGSVQLGTVNPAGVKMEIYRTDETNVNAVEYMGSTSAYNNDMYAYDNASYYRFTYTPNDTNKALLPNQNYIVVSSTLSTTGEFSIPFTYSKPRVCLVTRTQDDYLEGSLRWALGCAMRQGTVDTVKFAIPTADTAVITLNTNWTYQDGDGVIIDGYSQSGTYARKVHIIGSPSHGHLEFIMAHATIKGLIFTDCKILWQYSWDCVFQGNQMNWRPATYTTLGFRTQRWCNGNRFNGNVFNGKFYLSVLDVTSMLVKGNTFLNGARSTFVRCENIKYISNTSLNPNNSFGTLSLSRSSSCLADSNVLEKGTIFVSGSDNIVTNNYLYGAWTNTSGPLSVYGVSTSAADNNYLANNIIDNYGTGIGLQIIGNAKFNTASKNIIYNVAVNGIALDTGSNMKVKAPELKLLGVSNPDSVDVEITARRNGIIEIFKGNGKLNEATEYIRSVFIDSPVAENEIRTITARVPKNLLGSSKQYIIATLTDLQKNTSQFSNVLSSFSDGNCVVTDVTDKDVSGSLRAAIRCANFANNGKPVISFAIPGTDPKEIKLLTPLPKVQNIFGDSVVIDASTQASYIGNVGDATVMLKNDVNYKNDNNVEAVTFYKTRIKSLNADGLASLIMYNGGVLEAVNFKNFTTVLSGVGSEQFYLNNVTMASNNQILTSQNYPKEIKIVGSLFSSNNQISINPEILIIDNCQILNTNIPVNQALNSSSKYVTITNSKIGGYLSISSTDLVFNNNNLGCFSGTAITSTCYLAAETQMELKNNTFGNATGSDFLNIGPLGNSKPKITFDGNYFGQTIDKSYNCPITPRAIYGYGSIDLDLTNNHFFNIDSDAITYYDENTRQKVLNIKNNEFGSLLKPIKGDVLKLIGIGMASLTIQENIFEGNTVNSSENNDAIDLTGTFINAKINENTFKQTGRNAILISSGSFEINNNQFNNIGNDGIVSNVMVNMILKNNTFTNVSNNGLYISSRATVSISDGNNFKNINNYGVYSFGYGVDLTIKGNIFENCKIAALRLDSYYSNYEVSSNNIFKNNTRAITSYGGLRLIEANTFESTNPLANNDIYLHYANFGGSVIGNIATALDNTPGSFINFADNDRENALVKGNIITGYATSAIEIKNGVINKKISRNILDHATKAINLDKTSSTPGNANKPTPQFISVEPTIKGYTVKGNNTNLGDSVEIFLCNTRVRQKTNSWLLTKYVDKADGSWEVFVPFEGLPTFDIIALRATATKDFNTSELSEAIELPKITNGVCIVNNTSDNEIPGSLRAAVRCANYANNGKPVISFAIDGAAAKEIKLLTELPVVKNFLGDSVVIDGSTQALYSGNLGDPTIRITNDALFVSAPENSNVMYKVHLKKIQAEKISNIKMFEGGELDGVDFTDVITYCKTAGSRYYIKQSSFNSGASFYNPYITSNSDDIPNGMLIKNCSFNGINNSNQQLLEINVDDFKMYNTTMSRSDFGQLFTVRAENIVLNDNTLLGYFLAYKAKNVSADGNNIGCSSNALINKLTFIEASESISLKNNAIGGANSINGYQLRLGNIGTNSVVELLNNTFGYSTKDNTSCPINANGIHSYTHKKLTLTNNSFRSVNGNMLELLSVKENIISGNTFGSYTDPIKDYSIFINGGESSMVSGNNFYSNGVKNGGIIVNEVPLLTISGNQFDGIGKNAIELQNNIKGTIDKVNTFKNITENAVYLNGTNTTITAKGNHFENCLLGAIYLNASNSGTQEISGGNTFVNNKKSSILVNCPNVNISENVFTNNKRALNGNSTNLTISSNTFTATTDSNAIYFNTNGDGNVISNTVTALDVIPGSFLNFAPSSINTVLVKRNNISGYANSAISVTNEASNKKISRNILDHATKAININYNNSITILRGNGNKQAPTLSTLVPNLGLGGGLKVDISATIGDSVEVFLTELEIRSNTSKWIGTVYMDKAIVTYVIPAASFAEFTNIVGVRATATSGYNTSELSNLLSYKLNCTAIVTNTNDVGTGSLREAITCAYFKTEDVAIDFNFNSLVPTPYEIKLATTLPTVFNSYGKKVAINGLLGSGNSISITLKPANNTLVSPAMTLDANTEVKNIAIDYNSTSTTNKSFTTGLVLKNGATADNMRISYCSGTGVSCAHDAGMDLTKSNILRSSMLKGNGTGLAPSGTLATNIFFQNNDVWAGAQPTGLVANAQYGIYLNNNSLNHNLIVENSRFGIEPVTNAVSGLSVGGIYFGTGTNSAVDDLIKVTGSYFAGNKGYQIFTKAKTVVIENNYLGYTSSVNGTSTVDIGIGVAGTSKECTIRNNKITKVTNTLTPYAISLETTSLNNSVANISSNKIGFNNDVRINTKDVTSQGIRLFKSQFVNVDNNKINNGGFGIYAENISGALGTHIYTNNTITNSQISAITTKFQTAANISNNTISFESSLLQNISRDAAIRLVNVNSSTLNTNTITNHPLQAIVLDNSSNNQIKKGVYSTIIKSDIASLEFLNNSKSNIIEEEKYTKSGPVCVSIKNPGIGNVLTRTTLFSESANAITLAGGNGNRVAPIITSMQLRGNKIRLRVKATAKDIIEVFESSPTGTQLNKFLFSYTLNSTEENFDFDVSSLTKVNDFYYIRVTATSTINGTSKESNLAKLCPTCTCIVKNTSDHEVNSLREAITRANAGECGNINFEIPNQASPYLISLETVLPKINLNVNIDGTTQLGYNTVDKKPIIWLQTKDRVSPLATGLDFASDQIKIKAIGLKKFVTAINIITEENELNTVFTANTVNENVVIKTDISLINGSTFESCKFGTDELGTEIGSTTKSLININGIHNRFNNCAFGKTAQNNVFLTGIAEKNTFTKGSFQNSLSVPPAAIFFNSALVQKNKLTPAITKHEYIGNNLVISGTCQSSTDLIQLYLSNGKSQNATKFLTDGIAGSGNWSLTLNALDYSADESFSFIATATDVDGNTSRLSSIYATGFYVCFVTTNAETAPTGKTSLRDAIACVNSVSVKSKIEFRLPVTNNLSDLSLIFNSSGPALTLTNSVGVWIDGFNKIFDAQSKKWINGATPNSITLKKGSLAPTLTVNSAATTVENLKFDAINLTVSKGNNHKILKNEFLGSTLTFNGTSAISDIKDNKFSLNGRVSIFTSKQIRISKNIFQAQTGSSRSILLNLGANNNYAYPVISFEDAFAQQFYLRLKAKAGDTLELFSSCDKVQCATKLLGSYVIDATGTMVVPFNYADFNDLSSPQYFTATARDNSGNTSELSTTYTLNTCIVSSNLDYTPPALIKNTLRSEITNANLPNGCSVISFRIPSGMSKEIQLKNSLPPLTKLGSVINAASQAGFINATNDSIPQVTIKGISLGGLSLSGYQKVNGLVFDKMATAIAINNSNNSKISYCDFKEVRTGISISQSAGSVLRDNKANPKVAGDFVFTNASFANGTLVFKNKLKLNTKAIVMICNNSQDVQAKQNTTTSEEVDILSDYLFSINNSPRFLLELNELSGPNPGISLTSSTSSKIINNRFSKTSNSLDKTVGCSVISSEGSTVELNTFSGTPYMVGIISTGNKVVNINDNILGSVSDAGIYYHSELPSSNPIIKRNTIVYKNKPLQSIQAATGITALFTVSATNSKTDISENNISGNEFGPGLGISAENAPGSIVKNNTIKNFTTKGIDINEGLGSVLVSELTLNKIFNEKEVIDPVSKVKSFVKVGLGTGIYVSSTSPKVKISGNSIYNCATAMEIQSNGNEINANTIGNRDKKISNNLGIVLLGNNNVLGKSEMNTITETGKDGKTVTVTRPSYLGNTIMYNSEGGIQNKGQQNKMVYNIFIHNEESENVPNHLAIDNVNANNANDNISRPYAISYTRGTDPTLISITGKARANSNIHAYTTNGFPQDALVLMGETTSDGNGNWSLNITESANQTKTTYLVATATDVNNNTSELSKMLAIGNCYISNTRDLFDPLATVFLDADGYVANAGTSVLRDNEFPLEGTTRAAAVCANMAPEKATILTHVSGDTKLDVPLTGLLPTLTNSKGFDWSGKNRAYTSPTEFYLRLVPKDITQPLAYGLEIEIPDGVPAKLAKNKFAGLQTAVQIKSGKLSIEKAVVERNVSDKELMPTGTGSSFVNVLKTAAFSTLDAPTLNNVKAYDLDRIIQTDFAKLSSITIGGNSEFWNVVSAFNNADKEVGSITITDTKWHNVGNYWINAAKVETFSLDKDTLDGNQKDTKKVLEIAEVETSYITNCVFTDTVKSSLSTLSYILLPKANTSTIIGNSFNLRSHEQAIQLYSISRADLFENQYVNLLGNGIKISGKNISLQNEHFTTKGHAIIGESLADVIIKKCEIKLLKNTGTNVANGIYLTKSSNVIMESNLIQGNNDETKAINIKRDDVNLQSNGGKITPYGLKVQTIWKNGGPFDENTPWPSTPPLPVRIVSGEAESNDVIELFISGKTIPSDLQDPSANKEADTKEIIVERTTADANGHWEWEIPKNWNRAPDELFITVTGTGKNTTLNKGTSELSKLLLISALDVKCIVKNRDDAGPGSLRNAFNCVNGTDFRAEVIFDIQDAAVNNEQVIVLSSYLPEIYNYSGFDIKGATQPRNERIVVTMPSAMTPTTADPESKFGINVKPFCGDSTKLSDLTLRGFPKGIELNTGQAKLDNIVIEMPGSFTPPVLDSDWKGLVAISQKQVTGDKDPVATDKYPVTDKVVRTKTCTISGYKVGWDATKDLSDETSNDVNLASIKLVNNNFDHVGVGVKLPLILTKTKIEGNCFKNVYESGILFETNSASDGNEFLNNWFGVEKIGEAPTQGTHMNNAFKLRGVSSTLFKGNHIYALSEPTTNENGAGFYLYGIDAANAPANTFPPADRNSSPIEYTSRNNIFVENNIGWSNALKDVLNENKTSLSIGFSQAGVYAFSNSYVNNSVANIGTAVKIHNGAFDKISGNHFGHYQVIETDKPPVDKYLPINGNAIEFFESTEELVASNIIGNYGESSNGISISSSSTKPILTITKNTIRSGNELAGKGISYNKTEIIPVFTERAVLDNQYIKLLIDHTAKDGKIEVFTAPSPVVPGTPGPKISFSILGNKQQSLVYVGDAENLSNGKWEIKIFKDHFSLKDASYFVASYTTPGGNSSEFGTVSINNLLCDMTISLIPSYQVCPGITTKLNSGFEDKTLDYKWEQKSGSSYSTKPDFISPWNADTSFIASVKDKGDFRLTISDQAVSPNCSVSKDFSFTHYTAPSTPDFLVNKTGYVNEPLIILDNTKPIAANSTKEVTVWDWGLANLKPSTTVILPTTVSPGDVGKYQAITYPNSGKYTISQKITHDNQCSFSAKKEITIINREQGDKGDQTIPLVGAVMENFQMYPNPFTRGSVNPIISFETNLEPKPFSIYISRVQDGVALQRLDFTKKDLELVNGIYKFQYSVLGFNTLPGGVYVVRVEMENDVKTVRQIVN